LLLIIEAVAKLQFSTACHTREVFWKPLVTMIRCAVFSCAVAILIEFCNRHYQTMLNYAR
jgi:hypothetical protein